MKDSERWCELGKQLRVDSVRASAAAGSGHPTSSMSASDLMSVLLDQHLHYDFQDPHNPNNDHLIFSKGHASPLLYSMYKAVDVISDEELLSFRKFGSPFQGHPSPVLPWVNVASGSLGQGLPIGVGVALAGKYLDRLPYRVWVLCGDSEMAEGSMWEAFEHAAFWKLDNLTAIIDVNRLGQRGETMYGWDLDQYVARGKAFGWNTICADGHDVADINNAYMQATKLSGAPTVIVARTLKGKGVTGVENEDGLHGKPLKHLDDSIQELGGLQNIKVRPHLPVGQGVQHKFQSSVTENPSYATGTSTATRKAYGDALAALGSNRSDIVALDAEVGNSTFTETFGNAHPERFFEMFISEQQMVAAAVGIQVRNWTPFASSFAAFLSRGYDFIRMAAVSKANVCFVGSHAGVSIGEDGPSQMGLEDIAEFRAIHGSTVLYPCDANQTVSLVSQMADRKGIVYLRTTREATPVIYDTEQSFEIGGSHIVRSSKNDDLTIIGAGITLHEAIIAADELAEEGIIARVIDLYSIKPLDVETLRTAATDTGKIITVEDHWMDGGIGDAVLQSFAEFDQSPIVIRLAVTEMPMSGSPTELLDAAGIDAKHIAKAARNLVSGSN